jgi:hypothetical protein
MTLAKKQSQIEYVMLKLLLSVPVFRPLQTQTISNLLNQGILFKVFLGTRIKSHSEVIIVRLLCATVERNASSAFSGPWTTS